MKISELQQKLDQYKSACGDIDLGLNVYGPMDSEGCHELLCEIILEPGNISKVIGSNPVAIIFSFFLEKSL